MSDPNSSKTEMKETKNVKTKCKQNVQTVIVNQRTDISFDNIDISYLSYLSYLSPEPSHCFKL